MQNRTAAKRIGENLRIVRNELGLSLRAVQAKSGGRFSGAAVGSYERGDRYISAVNLIDLAEFYGVQPALLLGSGSGTMEKSVTLTWREAG